MTKLETNKNVVIQLTFTTTDGHELSIPEYAAVPAERLRKLEQIATAARELLAAQDPATVSGTSTMAAKALAELKTVLAELEGLWDLNAAGSERAGKGEASGTVQTDADKTRIEAGH